MRPAAGRNSNNIARNTSNSGSISTRACNRADVRCYPLGALTFHLLGDIRTRANWSAPNSSLVERDSAIRLQGYDDRARVVAVKDTTGKPFYTIRYDYRELLPLLRHRWEPENPAVKRIRDRERNVHLSISAALQVKAAQILNAHLAQQHLTRGAVVVMDPATGDLLASVNAPSPDLLQERLALGEASGSLLDRARYGLYPPGSTFKVVTAIAALRLNPALAHQQYQCIRLPDGRTGNYVGNSKRPIRDDEEDTGAHGTLDMDRAIVVSCNAYFAQLGTYKVGPEQLLDTAKMIGISVAESGDGEESEAADAAGVVRAGAGGGVAVSAGAGGVGDRGGWKSASRPVGNRRQQYAQSAAAAAAARECGGDSGEGHARRGHERYGTHGWPRFSRRSPGKTGTAELATAPSHAWFIGFAPYDDSIEANRVRDSGRERTLRRHGGGADRGRSGDGCATITFDSMSLLRRIEKSLDQRLRSLLFRRTGRAGCARGESSCIAMRSIRSRAVRRSANAGDRVFPFNLITIELRADDAERKAVLETLFDAGQLGERYPGDAQGGARHAAGRADGGGPVSRERAGRDAGDLRACRKSHGCRSSNAGLLCRRGCSRGTPGDLDGCGVSAGVCSRPAADQSRPRGGDRGCARQGDPAQ